MDQLLLIISFILPANETWGTRLVLSAQESEDVGLSLIDPGSRAYDDCKIMSEARPGSVLPPELVHQIIDSVLVNVNRSYYFDTSEHNPREIVLNHQSRVRKRHYSLCGRVCRYWASLCQRALFHAITLRSTTDVSTFKQILLTTPVTDLPPVGSLVREMYLNASMSNNPGDRSWLHLVPLLRLDASLPGLQSCTTLIHNWSTTPSPWSFDLPLPKIYNLLLPSFDASISKLVLANIRIKDAQTLCKLVLGIRGLYWLTLTHVYLESLSEYEPTLPHLLSVGCSTSVQEIHMTSGNAAVFAPHLLTTISAANLRGIFHAADYTAIAGIWDRFVGDRIRYREVVTMDIGNCE